MKVLNYVVNIVYYIHIHNYMDDLILIEYSLKAYCTNHTVLILAYQLTDDGRKTKSINLSLAIYYSQLQ